VGPGCARGAKKGEMKKILACDGGGIRGAASAEFLRLLELKIGQPLSEQFDMFAGTSTGAILTLGIGSIGLTAVQMSNLYNVDNAKIIMEDKSASDSWWKRFVQRALGPKFDGGGKILVLEKFFEKKFLRDSKKEVLAISYDVEKRSIAVLKNRNCGDLTVSEVADASSAAPTYFPGKRISDGRWLIDGGVTANNPSMCAIAEAARLWPGEEIRILSIGTGLKTEKIDGSGTAKAGYLQWALQFDLLNTIMDETVVDYQVEQIIKDGNYLRVNSELVHASDAMDDISTENIQKLKELGLEWFEKFGSKAIGLMSANT
jgi:patatin-like phospholipase/acyl hydrolase